MINLSQMSADVYRFAKRLEGAKAPGGSLTRLSEDLLGTPLDKAETMSNWNNRPLRPAQLHYAGKDAYDYWGNSRCR